jgi:hypothetical protein
MPRCPEMLAVSSASDTNTQVVLAKSLEQLVATRRPTERPRRLGSSIAVAAADAIHLRAMDDNPLIELGHRNGPPPHPGSPERATFPTVLADCRQSRG